MFSLYGTSEIDTWV